MKTENFGSVLKDILSNRDSRIAAHENFIRRGLGRWFDDARLEKGLSLREFAKYIGTSLSQTQRLLHKQLGGSLTLKTLCKAADVFGFRIEIKFIEQNQESLDICGDLTESKDKGG